MVPRRIPELRRPDLKLCLLSEYVTERVDGVAFRLGSRGEQPIYDRVVERKSSKLFGLILERDYRNTKAPGLAGTELVCFDMPWSSPSCDPANTGIFS